MPPALSACADTRLWPRYWHTRGLFYALPQLVDMRPRVIMLQDFLIVLAPLRHADGPGLAQAHAMPEPRAIERD